MSKPFGWSDDYAWMHANGFEFYYGYEVTKDVGDAGDEEWSFQAKKGGVVVETWYWGEIGMKRGDSFECVDCLLAGIAMFLAKYPPQVPE